MSRDIDVRISRPFDVRDPKAYGVKVRGDSMMPKYEPGQVLVVSPNIRVKDGDRASVMLLNGERLIKRVRRMRNGWLLESINSAYETRAVNKSEIGAMHKIVWTKEKD